MVFGIVVEGQPDGNVYSALIQRIRSDVEFVLSRPCTGVSGVRKTFVGWLKNFQWHAGYQVGKALVIRDSDRHDPEAAENELARILQQSGFCPTFPVHFHATKCEMETWLLADENAVNIVSQQRGKGAAARAVVGSPEDVQDAKELFQHMLWQAGLPADPAVYGEVARAVDMERIRLRCPRFRHFVERVRAC